MTDLVIITGLIALMAFGVERFSHEISRRRRVQRIMWRFEDDRNRTGGA